MEQVNTKKKVLIVDRHLTRLASHAGYNDVQLFYRDISSQTGDSVPVVDIVLWRFATINENYLNFFPKALAIDFCRIE
jgi:hypothetical protein